MGGDSGKAVSRRQRSTPPPSWKTRPITWKSVPRDIVLTVIGAFLLAASVYLLTHVINGAAYHLGYGTGVAAEVTKSTRSGILPPKTGDRVAGEARALDDDRILYIYSVGSDAVGTTITVTPRLIRTGTPDYGYHDRVAASQEYVYAIGTVLIFGLASIFLLTGIMGLIPRRFLWRYHLRGRARNVKRLQGRSELRLR